MLESLQCLAHLPALDLATAVESAPHNTGQRAGSDGVFV